MFASIRCHVPAPEALLVRHPPAIRSPACRTQTLSDPVKRALYDELAGFSADSLNPFLDDRWAPYSAIHRAAGQEGLWWDGSPPLHAEFWPCMTERCEAAERRERIWSYGFGAAGSGAGWVAETHGEQRRGGAGGGWGWIDVVRRPSTGISQAGRRCGG